MWAGPSPGPGRRSDQPGRPNRRLDLLVDDAELARWRESWQPTRTIPSRGYIAMFAQHVTQAHRGCDFDFLHAGEAIPEPEIH